MKTIIVYTSMTGNTECMADTIAEELTKLGEIVVLKDAIGVYAAELMSYERILLGTYTWGDGDLPDELVDFHHELRNTNLTGKVAAAFGSGDSSYDHFCGAVDILEETLRTQGCEILIDGLKVDQESPDVIKTKCQTFSKKLVCDSNSI